MKREEEKIKENEKIDKKEEINNNKKDKNIILIILWIIFFIALGVIIIKFVKPNDNDKEDIDDKKDNIQLSGNVEFPKDVEFEEFEGLGFYCSNEEYYTGTYNYELGTDVYCGISFELSGNKKVKEIYGEFSFDENIEYIGIHDVWEDWNLIQNGNKFHLTTDKSTSYAEGFYTLKFKVNKLPEDELINIEFKNLIAKDEDNKYYKFEDDIISLNQTKPIQPTPTNYKYEKDEEKNELVFYKYDEINNNYNEINRYKCQNDNCGIYGAYQFYYEDKTNGKILMYDGEEKIENNDNSYIINYKKIGVFDFNKGISEEYNDIKQIEWLEYDKYIFLLDKNGNEFIIDDNGTCIKKFTNSLIKLERINGMILKNYSLENDIIVTIKDGKYGIDSFTKSEEKIEHKFDDIRLFDIMSYDISVEYYKKNKYFKAKENNKWYLYSLETKNKVIEFGYEDFLVINEKTIITLENNNLYIKDYYNNNLSSDGIKINNLCEISGKKIGGVFIEKNSEILNVRICDCQNYPDLKYYNYEYNAETKELTKKEI